MSFIELAQRTQVMMLNVGGHLEILQAPLNASHLKGKFEHLHGWLSLEIIDPLGPLLIAELN
jgi:hypothetical protein